MIKSVLLGALFVAGLGAGVANAQDRTITFWNHDFEVQNTNQSPSGFVALAPETMHDRIAPRHRTHSLSKDTLR